MMMMTMMRMRMRMAHLLSKPTKASCPVNGDRLASNFCPRPIKLHNRFSALGAPEEEQEDDSPTERGLGLLESETPQLYVMDNEEFLDFGVILDSRAADHVVDSADAPATRSRRSLAAEQERVS